MSDPAALLRLFSWLSPALPIGGFAYSQGLETAIVETRVATISTLKDWIEGQLHAGPVRTDAYFLAIAAACVGTNDPARLTETNGLALALQTGSERDKETREQARSFLDAARSWPTPLPSWLEETLEGPITLPVAFGAMAAAHGLDRSAAVAGFINAAIAQQISVAVRLVPLGQTEGLKLLASLEPDISALASAALDATLLDISSIGYGADIAAMRHEDLRVRIFRS